MRGYLLHTLELFNFFRRSIKDVAVGQSRRSETSFYLDDKKRTAPAEFGISRQTCIAQILTPNVACDKIRVGLTEIENCG